MNESAIYQIRPYQASSDENFLYATWLKGLYHGNEFIHHVPQRIYYSNYHRVIEMILKRPTTQVMCACLKKDQDTILSYAVLDPSQHLLHWIFTKKSFRRFGLAKSLIPQDIRYVTSLTRLGYNIKPSHWEFNPFLI